jgi:hypothetical protein
MSGIAMGLTIARLRNIGISLWWFLLYLIPILGLYVTVICLMVPPGYQQHRQFDTADRVILTILAALVTNWTHSSRQIVRKAYARAVRKAERSAGGRARMTISQSHRRAFAEETLIIAREATKVKEAVADSNTFDAGLFWIGIREHMPRSVESTNLAEL